MAKPFLRWAGSKRQQVHSIRPHLLGKLRSDAPTNERPDCYIEPFVGGGSVFFGLQEEGWFDGVQVILSDTNMPLIRAYQGIQQDVIAVMDCLAEMKDQPDHEEFYYEQREVNPLALPPPLAAAHLLYMNRMGFNGLYRVNSKGQYNTPFGEVREGEITDYENLRGVAKALQGVNLVIGDYGSVLGQFLSQYEFADLKKHPIAVYLDPPYIPIKETSFTAFAGKFGPDEHVELAEVYVKLLDHGFRAVLSNSDTPLTRELYDGCKLVEVSHKHNIAADPAARGLRAELLVVGLKGGR